MAKVFICIGEHTKYTHTEDAWTYTIISKVFSNEESAKKWIDDLWLAHQSGNDGATHQEDIGIRWCKGEVYAREYIDIDGIIYQDEYCIREYEVVD